MGFRRKSPPYLFTLLMNKRLVYKSVIAIITAAGLAGLLILILKPWAVSLPTPLSQIIQSTAPFLILWGGWGAYLSFAFLLLFGITLIFRWGPPAIPYLAFMGLGSLLLDLLLYLLGQRGATGKIGYWLGSEISVYIGFYGLLALVCLFLIGLLCTLGAHRFIIFLGKGGKWLWNLIWNSSLGKEKKEPTPSPRSRGKEVPTLEVVTSKKQKEESPEDAFEPLEWEDFLAKDEPLPGMPRHHKGERPLEIKEAPSRGGKEHWKGGRMGKYRLPSLDLLDLPPSGREKADHSLLESNALKLEERLGNYGVTGKVVSIHHGPVVTMFEFQPALGVKVSRIANLADDIAMAMKAMGVRIVAPIPGKDVVGIEIPNEHRDMVYFREIVGSDRFKGSSSPLTMALGKDIFGKPFVADLKRMPHLLVAGATGSGKSVGLNTIICSILYKATPEKVKFIMVDPKMLEFSVYNGVPHLITPVITDPRKAASALSWAVSEMERRYAVLTEMGVRNIQGYNSQADESLPYIVIIIDELADLMMLAAREVETLIARLAQKARAAGIHLVVATQRPSVDVVTGLIKANFSSRISFKVSSRVDSRTILDIMGAEKLLRLGDMLFLPPGTSDLLRLHGAYISDDEIYKVAQFWREQEEPSFNEEVVSRPLVEEGEAGNDLDDELYPQALELVVRTGQASASMIQRYLKIGYNRAARLMDRMEREGVVGPAQGSKPREVLLTPQDLERTPSGEGG